jgi:orotate phosphoribosyltransferase
MRTPIDAADRKKLKTMLTRKSVQGGKKFKLASGAVSDVYIDAKRTTLRPEAMPLIGRAFLQKIAECGWSPKAVGGKTVGADPIAFSIARESLDFGGSPVSAFIVRKEPKKHGMEQYIEGPEQTQGLQVVVVDDVCTKGSSTGEAIDKARKAGMIVLGAICLVDREEGATKFLWDKYECRLDSIFKMSELLAEHDIPAEPIGAH